MAEYKRKPCAIVIPTYDYLKDDGKKIGENVWRCIQNLDCEEYFDRCYAPLVKQGDGTIKVDDITNSVGEKNVYIIHPQYDDQPARHEKGGRLVIQAADLAKADNIYIIEPFNPFFSYDRPDLLQRESLGAKDTIRGYETASEHAPVTIVTFDPHFKQISGFGTVDWYPLLGELSAHLKILYPYISSEDWVVSPVDENSNKEAQRFSECLGIDRLTAEKSRSSKGEKTKGFRLYGELKPNVIIRDDMVRSGSTLNGTCNALRAMSKEKRVPIKKRVFVPTHAGFYEGTDMLDEHDIEVVTTNTIPKEWDNPRIRDSYDISDLIADYVTKRVTGRSFRARLRQNIDDKVLSHT